MAYKWAKPGVKCVCIDAAYHGTGSEIDAAKLVSGEQYVLETVFVDPFGVAGCTVVGIQNASLGYALSRFRPLITKTQEQDIEMFLRLASPSPLERLDLLAERMNELAED